MDCDSCVCICQPKNDKYYPDQLQLQQDWCSISSNAAVVPSRRGEQVADKWKKMDGWMDSYSATKTVFYLILLGTPNISGEKCSLSVMFCTLIQRSHF